jgi:type II secretory pathway pseudopilin PulG
LVELLVVIAIITVLASLFLPTVRRAVEKGHAAGCLSNLRQVGSAMIMAAGDENGFLPNAYGTCRGPGSGRPCKWGLTDFYWARMVREYAEGAHRCSKFKNNFLGHSEISYAFSDWGRAHSWYPYHVKLDDFRAPSRAVMVIDRYDNPADDLYFRPRLGQALYDPDYRHLGGVNAVHPDGSGGWLAGVLWTSVENWTDQWHFLYLWNAELAHLVREDQAGN